MDTQPAIQQGSPASPPDAGVGPFARVEPTADWADTASDTVPLGLPDPESQAQPSPPLAPISAFERMPPLAAADFQDHLLVATNDLDRLHRLLLDASQALIGHFHGAAGQMKLLLRQAARHPEIDATSLNLAMDHLAAAITSLQFQDMASQLLDHTGRRLRACADRLAIDAMAMDDDDNQPGFVDTVPLAPNPVTQDEMDAGSVELF